MTSNINDNIPTTHDLASFHRKLSTENVRMASHPYTHMILSEFVEVMRTELLEVWDYLHQRENSLPASPVLKVKLLSPHAKVPTRGSEGAIGWDLYATHTEGISPEMFKLWLKPHDRFAVETGIALAIPPGYYARIAPRSGLAVKQGIDVLAGVIDSDYRGEIKVVLANTSDTIVIVDLTKPIAQLILERADAGVVMVVEDLDETERGSGGFGSTDHKEGGKL